MPATPVLLTAVKDGALKGLKTALLLFRIVLPIFIIVDVVGRTGFYSWLAERLEPAMRIFALPGEAVVPLIVGVFSDEYAVVAAMTPFSFDQAQITIIAMIALYFHSIPVETVVSLKIGIPPLKIALFRLVMAVITGIVVAYLTAVFLEGNIPFVPGAVQAGGASAAVAVQNTGAASFAFIFDTELSVLLPELGLGILKLMLMLVRVLIPMMIVIEIMFAYNIVQILAKKLSPVCKLFGIGQNALIPLLVGFLLGITYGAGAIIELNKKTPLSQRDLWMLGIFLFSCHGIIEATYLFAVVGGNALIMSGVRLLIAVAVTALFARLPQKPVPAR